MKNSVRQFYSGYIGWYQGDPWEVDRLPPLRRAARYVRAMGGRDAVLDEAKQAIERGEPTWAAEILTYLLRMDAEDQEARLLKARALREWGYEQITSTWRNWALTAAKELEGDLPAGAGIMKSSPDIANAIPSGRMAELLSTRLKAEQCGEVRQLVGMVIADTGEAFALELRRGIAEFHPELPDAAVETIRLARQQLVDLFIGKRSLANIVEQADPVAIAGSRAKIAAFASCFETPDRGAITLSVPVDFGYSEVDDL